MRRSRMAFFAVIAFVICMVSDVTDVFAAQLKKTIAVSKFENKANYSGNINFGNSIADQLTRALMSRGNFVVIQLQGMGNVMGRQEGLTAGGRAAQSKTTQIEKLIPAQIFIKGAVTQFEMRKKRRSPDDDYGTSDRGSPWDSKGAGGGFSHLSGESYTARAAVILQLIDTTSGEILDTFKTKGKVTTRSNKRSALGTRGFEKTALGKALQKALKKAVSKITKRLRKIPFTGKIIKVEGENIYTDIGARNGVTIGETFDVYAVKKEKMGSIVITSVKEKYSKASPKSGEFFKKGYIVTK